jgi:hypothetical protein
MGPGDSAGYPNPSLSTDQSIYDPTFGPNFDTSAEGNGSLATPGQFPNLLSWVPWYLWLGLGIGGLILILHELNPTLTLLDDLFGKGRK